MLALSTASIYQVRSMIHPVIPVLLSENTQLFSQETGHTHTQHALTLVKATYIHSYLCRRHAACEGERAPHETWRAGALWQNVPDT